MNGDQLGALGFFISVILAIIRIVEFWRDRASLRIDANLDQADLRIDLRITNTGRRAVSLARIGVNLPMEIVSPEAEVCVNAKLSESEQKNYWWDLSLGAAKCLPRSFKVFVVTSGKRTYSELVVIDKEQWNGLQESFDRKLARVQRLSEGLAKARGIMRNPGAKVK